jgi:3-deoxy-D-manno-octulosonate 8-phosphate phosphatase (KDO 8-P phosphatase)
MVMMVAENGLPQALAYIPMDIVERARQIKLIATDVDGVLTPSTIIWDANGVEQKVFNVKDGWALQKVKKMGLHTAIITGRKSSIVELRGKELKFDYVYQAVPDKRIVLQEIIDALKITLDQVAYMGDDVPDVCVMEQVGLSTCPSDASFEAREASHMVMSYKGGEGAMRELLDIIRYAQAPESVGDFKGYTG